jgi:type I restriction enzyme S subunit
MSDLCRDIRQTDIGPLPSAWGISRIKDKFTLINGFPFDSNRFEVEEGFPLIRIRDLNKSQTEARYKGEWVETAAVSSSDLLIGMDGDFNIGRWLGSERALLNQRTCCLRGEEYITKYAEYFLPLELKKINDVTYATTVKHLSSLEINKIKIPLPPLEELIKIVTLLDRETAKIDELIERQEKLVELLQEKKHISVLEVMFKGLNQSAKPKKASEIFWADEIPEHWSEHRVKFIFEIKKRIAGKLGYDVLSITQQGIKVKDIESNEGQLSMDYSKYQIVESGDFAMNHMDLLTGYVDISTQLGVTSPDYRVFSIRDESKYFPGFYLLLLQLGYKSKLFFPFGQGAAQVGRWRLPTAAFNNFLFPVPPIDEQIEICNSINKKNNKIDKLIDKASLSINLLKEHRASLISAVVMGKIDVRGLVQK